MPSRSRPPLAALACTGLVVLLHAGALLASWTDFLPRTFDNGAYLELTGLLEEDEFHNGERSFRWTDTFFKEKLTLFSNGYVYHPRFLLFRAAVTGGVSQERYDTTLTPSDEWRSDDAFEYDFTLQLLPEHSYNLKLFARRYEPLFTERLANRENSIATSQGVDFRYRKKPYFLHALYVDDTLTAAPFSSEVRRLGLNGEYFKQFQGGDYFSVTAAFNPSRFKSSTGLEGNSQEALLGNLLAFGRYRLNSNLSQTVFTQDRRESERFESEQLVWEERFTVELPLNLQGDLSYRHQENSNLFPDSFQGQVAELSHLSRDLIATLSHQLFESLTSSYSFTKTSRGSSGGASDALSHQLGFAYDKSIPNGRLLLGTNLGRTEIESTGQTDVANELHPGVAVPGTFALLQENVQPASVVLFVRSPVSPFESIQLTEGPHYQVSTVANALEIHIFSLPPQFALPGSYDFTASYSLVDGGFGIRSQLRSFSGSVSLFDDLLTPFATYSAIASEVTSGTYPGAIPDSTTTTVGILLKRGGLRARGEYRDISWNTSPYTLWLGELRYTGALSPSTRINASVSHRRWDYPQGRSNSSDLPQEAEIQTVDMAAVDLQQRLFRRTLLLSVGGSYSEIHSLLDSRAHSLNFTLSWKLGRTDLSAGGSIYSSEAERGGIAISERTRTLYHLRLRRDLF